MKNLIFSSLVGLALISFTACSHENEVNTSAKCQSGKCQSDKAKSSKCSGDKAVSSKCGGDKKATSKCSSAGKCGK